MDLLDASQLARDPTHERQMRQQGLVVAACGPVLIDVWTAPPTVARLDELARVQRAFAVRVPRHAVLTVIDPQVGREMADDARARTRALVDEMEPHTVAVAHLVLGSGFFAALARSIVTGVLVLSQRRPAWRVVAEAAEGVRFLEEALGREGLTLDVPAATRLVERLAHPV